MIIIRKLTWRKALINLLKSLESIFAWFLVFLSPTQLIKHFWPSWSLVFGIRVDYLSLSFSLIEILIFSLFFLWFLKTLFFERKSLKKFFLLFLNPYFLLLVFFFFLDIFVGDYRINSFFSWLKIFLLFWLFYYLSFLNRKKFSDWFFWPASFSLLFFGFVAILQFLKGASLNSFFYWLGERSFDKNTPGISLIYFGGRDFLRAYSTFSHPNSLAGYFGVFLILFLNFLPKNLFQNIYKIFVISFSLFVFFLSFSRGSFFALLFCFLIFLLIKKVPAKKIYFLIISFVFLISLFSLFIPSNLETRFLKGSVKERIDLIRSSRDVFLKKPFLGFGLNNFILKTSYNFDIRNINYQLQPVHNIYLLILSELGFFGFLFFYLILLRLYYYSSLSFRPWFFLALTFVIISGVVDHYWLTLMQNRLALVFLSALILREKKWKKRRL